eukprot:1156723-Pelagomonas_calceolata.AAC.14
MAAMQVMMQERCCSTNRRALGCADRHTRGWGACVGTDGGNASDGALMKTRRMRISYSAREFLIITAHNISFWQNCEPSSCTGLPLHACGCRRWKQKPHTSDSELSSYFTQMTRVHKKAVLVGA